MLNMMYQTTMAQAGFNQTQQQTDGMDFLSQSSSNETSIPQIDENNGENE